MKADTNGTAVLVYMEAYEIDLDNTKRDIPYACSSQGGLEMTLNNGTLIDVQGRTGAIVGNHQFQVSFPIIVDFRSH